MTPWRWWADHADNAECGEFALGDFDTREEALAAVTREYGVGQPVVLIEARSSESMKYEGADIVPFLRSRNREALITGSPPGQSTTLGGV